MAGMGTWSGPVRGWSGASPLPQVDLGIPTEVVFVTRSRVGPGKPGVPNWDSRTFGFFKLCWCAAGFGPPWGPNLPTRLRWLPHDYRLRRGNGLARTTGAHVSEIGPHPDLGRISLDFQDH